MNDFCIFIISHGRPDKIITLDLLKKYESKIPLYIVIDNEDKTSGEYCKKYGDIVLMFDKAAIAKTVDNGDNFNNLMTTTHARNACFNLAKDLKCRYFLVLDDDYYVFSYRINSKREYPTNKFLAKKTIDEVILSTLEYFKTIPAKSICWSQGGDWMGGDQSSLAEYPIKRKAMNSWFCDTERRFNFISRLNEDVNTYLSLGSRGDLFFTIPFFNINQIQTQATDGGMTEAYLDGGTYVKSFYTVMYCPSCAKISTMGLSARRIHHSITWNNAVPQIVGEQYRKRSKE